MSLEEFSQNDASTVRFDNVASADIVGPVASLNENMRQNRLDELPESYRRYLLNAMRRDLGLGPVPLRLDFRGRSNPFDRGR